MGYQIPKTFKHLKTAYRLTEKLVDIFSLVFVGSTFLMSTFMWSPYAREIIIIWVIAVFVAAILSLIAVVSIFYYFYLKPMNKTLAEELRFIKDFIQKHESQNEAISLDDSKKIWWIFALTKRTIKSLNNREGRFLDSRSTNCLKNLVKNLDHVKKILKVLKIREMKNISTILEEYAKIFEKNNYAHLYKTDEKFKRYIENNNEYKRYLSDENEMKFKSKLYGFLKRIDIFGIVNKIIQNKDRIVDFIKLLIIILLGILMIIIIIYWIFNYQTIANSPEIIMEIINRFLV
jgi:hypothetical protein